jgi:flagellar assembly protein FliH
MGLIKAEKTPPALGAFSFQDIEAQARSVLQMARKRAEQFLAAAQAEAQVIRREAHEKGLAEGRAKGEAAGLEAGRKAGSDAALAEHREKLSLLIGSLTLALKNVEASRADLESNALRDVVSLAAAIARRVTKRQGMIDAEVLSENVRGALSLVMHESDVRVALNPAQRDTLAAVLPKIKFQWPQFSHIELIEDATLAAGGCRVFTASGSIDGDLDAQLDRVIADVLPGPTGGAGPAAVALVPSVAAANASDVSVARAEPSPSNAEAGA